MNIIIKGMDMPENCNYCRFNYDTLCHAARQSFFTHKKINGKLEDCPLVAVPPFFAVNNNQQESVCYKACLGTKCIPCKPTFPECKFCEYAYETDDKK